MFILSIFFLPESLVSHEVRALFEELGCFAKDWPPHGSRREISLVVSHFVPSEQRRTEQDEDKEKTNHHHHYSHLTLFSLFLFFFCSAFRERVREREGDLNVVETRRVCL